MTIHEARMCNAGDTQPSRSNRASAQTMYYSIEWMWTGSIPSQCKSSVTIRLEQSRTESDSDSI